jgi:hypothetical protein
MIRTTAEVDSIVMTLVAVDSTVMLHVVITIRTIGVAMVAITVMMDTAAIVICNVASVTTEMGVVTGVVTVVISVETAVMTVVPLRVGVAVGEPPRPMLM